MARVKTKGRASVEKNSKSLERLTVEYIDIGSVSPNAYNPNRQSEHDFELLCRSIEEDGFTQPVIVRKSDSMIVDGEHRWRAAREMGYSEIPVVYVEFSDEQMKISTLRHNRARGSEDLELGAEVLRDLQKLGALDWAQDSLMLDDTELNMLLNDVAAPEAQGGEDFSGAWDPGLADSVGDGLSEDGSSTVSRTAAASDRQREIEKRIAQAKTEEEREQARRESDIFRVVAIFSGDEAEVVKRVLGNRVADRLIEICNRLDADGDHAE